MVIFQLTNKLSSPPNPQNCHQEAEVCFRKTIILKVESMDRTENVKADIPDKERIPSDWQKLILAGKQLENRYILTTFKVHSSS